MKRPDTAQLLAGWRLMRIPVVLVVLYLVLRAILAALSERHGFGSPGGMGPGYLAVAGAVVALRVLLLIILPAVIAYRTAARSSACCTESSTEVYDGRARTRSCRTTVDSLLDRLHGQLEGGQDAYCDYEGVVARGSGVVVGRGDDEDRQDQEQKVFHRSLPWLDSRVRGADSPVPQLNSAKGSATPTERQGLGGDRRSRPFRRA